MTINIEKNQIAELTIAGQAPEDFKDASVFAQFDTSTSESYLLEVGRFEDGEPMFVLAERFESTDWKWSNSFPEMDALQMADYLSGYSRNEDIGNEDSAEYRRGLEKFANQLTESFNSRWWNSDDYRQPLPMEKRWDHRAFEKEVERRKKAKEDYQKTIAFEIGDPNPYGKYFTGRSYLAPISTEQVPVYNVTFEPGCRNNWHIHHAKKDGGQMLICIGGRGYYQEWGKEAVELTPGSVINIPANVKHWHGAAADSWFSHLALEIPGERTSTAWHEPVSDEEYGALG